MLASKLSCHHAELMKYSRVIILVQTSFSLTKSCDHTHADRCSRLTLDLTICRFGKVGRETGFYSTEDVNEGRACSSIGSLHSSGYFIHVQRIPTWWAAKKWRLHDVLVLQMCASQTVQTISFRCGSDWYLPFARFLGFRLKKTGARTCPSEAVRNSFS